MPLSSTVLTSENSHFVNGCDSKHSLFCAQVLQLLFAESAELYARSFYVCDDNGIFDYSSSFSKRATIR